MFWDALPFYLSIGMTADEYWFGHPNLVTAYREAWKLKMRHENEVAHLQGFYVHAAVAVALANGFAKKGSKKERYIDAVDLGLDTAAEKEAKAQQAREKIVASLNAWKKAWDRQQQKSGENQ